MVHPTQARTNSNGAATTQGQNVSAFSTALASAAVAKPKDAAGRILASGKDPKTRLKALAKELQGANAAYGRELIAEIRKQDPDADKWMRADTADQMVKDGELSAGDRAAISAAMTDPETQRETNRALAGTSTGTPTPSATPTSANASTVAAADSASPLTAAEIDKLKTGTDQEKLEVLAKLAKALGNGKDVPIAAVQKFLADNGVKNAMLDKLVKSQKALGSLITMIDTLKGNGSPTEKVAAVLDFMQAAGGNFTGKLGDLLKKPLEKVAGAQAIIDGINKLCDPKASAFDKVSAMLGIAGGLEKAGALGALKGKLAETLRTYLGGAKNAQAIVTAVSTLIDTNASGIDRAKAAFDLVKNLKEIGELDAAQAKKLRGLNPFMNIVSDVITLSDPKAGLQDKIAAGLDLAAQLPDLKGNIQEFKRLLASKGIPADEADTITRVATGLVGEKVAKALTPEVLRSLSNAELQQVLDLVNNGQVGDSVLNALKKLETPEAAHALLKSVAGMTDDAAKKALLDAVGAMAPGVADKLLVQTIDGKTGTEILTGLVTKLDAGGRTALTQLLGSLDARGMKVFLQLVDKLPADKLSKLMPILAKNGGVANSFLKLVDSVLTRRGIQLTEKLALRIFGAIAKAIPVVGAVPNAVDIYDLSKVYGDKSIPPEIRYLAGVGIKVNGVDAILAIAEPFIDEFGVPILASLGMAGLELVIGIAVDTEVEKARTQGSNYVAPDWLKTADVAAALASGPQGMVELYNTLGAEKFEDAVQTAIRAGGEAAIKVAQWLGTAEAQNLRLSAHVVAQGLHLLADVIRNPGKYGDAAEAMAKQAIATLVNLAKDATALGKAALTELKLVVGDLKKLGVRGLETLKWIAQNPGQAAGIAKDALVDLVAQGLDVGKAAYDTLVSLGADGIDLAKKAVRALIAAGKNVPEMLNYIMGKGGDFAKAAYQELLKIGPAAKDAVIGLVKSLAAGGEHAVEMLKYIIENPGQFGDDVRKAVVGALADIVRHAEASAKAAVDALVHLVKEGIPGAKDILVELAKEGGKMAGYIAEQLGSAVVDGAKDIWGGVTDVWGAVTG